jgi:hypothetical protein
MATSKGFARMRFSVATPGARPAVPQGATSNVTLIIFVIPVAALVKASRNNSGCGQRYRQQPFSLDIERPYRCHRYSGRRSRVNRRGPACPHESGAQPRHFAPNASITSIKPTIWVLNPGRSSAEIDFQRPGCSSARPPTSADVIRTSNEMLGTLIDVHA